MKPQVIIFLIFVYLTNATCEPKNSDSAKNKDCLAVGIDFGLKYSRIAIPRNGTAEIIPNEYNSRSIPSIVAFTDQEVLVGEAAKNNLLVSPKRTIHNIRNLLGQNFDSEAVQFEKKHQQVSIIEKQQKPFISIGNSKPTCEGYSPEEIAAIIFNNLKQSAEKHLETPVKDAVITVPAYFSDAQRQSVKDAATLAGLNVLRIINEPTAAAIAYDFQNTKDEERYLLVIDLQSNYIDITPIFVDFGVFEILSTYHGPSLGIEAFNQRSLNHFIETISQKFEVHLVTESEKMIEAAENEKRIEKLKAEIERAHRNLADESETILTINDFINGQDFFELYTKNQFEALNSDLLESVGNAIEKALNDANLQKEQICDIIVVGLFNRIPELMDRIVKLFEHKPKLYMSIDPEEVVVYGAARHAHVFCEDPNDRIFSPWDFIPFTITILAGDEEVIGIIPRYTRIPLLKLFNITINRNDHEVIKLKVYEGDREILNHNVLIAAFEIRSNLSTPKNISVIEAEFEIDPNSVLTMALASPDGQFLPVREQLEYPKLSYEELEILMKLQYSPENSSEELLSTFESILNKHAENVKYVYLNDKSDTT